MCPTSIKDDFKMNLYGAFTFNSAIHEFSQINKAHSSIDIALHIIFGSLKLIPVIGNITYLLQKCVRWINNPKVNSRPESPNPHLNPTDYKSEKNYVLDEVFKNIDLTGLQLVEDSKVREDVFLIIQKLSESLDDALKTVIEADQKTLLGSFVVNSLSGVSDFMLPHFLNKMLAKDPTLFDDIFKEKGVAEKFISRSGCLIWAKENASHLIGQCLSHHENPLLKFYSSGCSDEDSLIWNYVINDVDLLKELITKKEVISSQFYSEKLSEGLIKNIFDCKDEVFDLIYPTNSLNIHVFNYLIELATSDRRTSQKVIRGLAINHTERLSSFVKANLDDFCESYYYNQQLNFKKIKLEKVVIFAACSGQDVSQHISNKLSADIKTYIEKSIDLHVNSPNYYIGNPLEFIDFFLGVDRGLFRQVAIKKAKTESNNSTKYNLMWIAIVENIRLQRNGDDLASWLSLRDPLLFIHLIGMIENLDQLTDSTKIKHFFENTGKCIELDVNSLPTGQELSLFFKKLNSISVDLSLLSINISITDVKEFKMLKELFNSTVKEFSQPYKTLNNISVDLSLPSLDTSNELNKENIKLEKLSESTAAKTMTSLIKINFGSTHFNLTSFLRKSDLYREEFQVQNGKIKLHRVLLESFCISQEDLRKMNLEDVESLEKFIYSGSCTLENAGNMLQLMENKKPLTYLNEDEFNALEKTENKSCYSKVIYNEIIEGEPRAKPYYIQKIIGVIEPTLANLISPQEMGMNNESWTIDGNDIQLKNFLLFLNTLYTYSCTREIGGCRLLNYWLPWESLNSQDVMELRDLSDYLNMERLTTILDRYLSKS